MMKKRILSLALVLLMMLAILPGSAYADNYVNLNSWAAGSSINSGLGTLPSGSSFTTGGTIPPGCNIYADASGTLYLTGTLTTVGAYNFSISITNGNSATQITCSITVTPAIPIVSVSSGVNCLVGETALLSAAASVTDGGMLSYQWYVSDNVNYGGAAIVGANSAEYSASTTSVGTRYYYCVVTNTNGGMTASATSSLISVSVSEAVVSSIMVNTMPQKTRYTVGESIDTSGLSIVVTYSNGSTQVVYSGYNVYPTILTSNGTASIELTYGGKTCSFPVTVTENSVTGISLVSYPTKTTYDQGDSFDPTGLVFRVSYSDGSYTDVDSGYTYSPKTLVSSGVQTVTITYKNQTCTLQVSVNAKETEQKLEVASTPAKLSYNVGDKLNTSGLALKLTENGTTKIINSGFTCEPETLETSGTQTVTVRYGDLSATFTVSVSGTASPSPTVSASPSPSSEVSPSSSANSERTSRKSGSGKGVLAAILIVALLCLIGLGFYMLVMNAGGWEEFKNRVDYRLYKIKRKFRRK